MLHKKMNKSGGITIPQQLRHELGFGAGTAFDIEPTDEGLLLPNTLQRVVFAAVKTISFSTAALKSAKDVPMKSQGGLRFMQINEDEIRQKADELAALSLQLDITKLKVDSLKGYFQRLAVQQLRDKKVKTVEYWGNENVKITVSNSEAVKTVSVTSIKNLFGEAFGDFVKEEMSYTMTAPCKRLFAIAFQGEYSSGSLDETIRQISSDIKTQTILKKKLKGKFLKDKQMLMNIAGLSDEDASE